MQQPWKVATLLWPTVVAFLLPLSLVELVAALPAIAAQLTAYDDVAMSSTMKIAVGAFASDHVS